MSGLEVIGAISAVISIVDASIKIYGSVKQDVKLPDTFHVVGRRLPIIRDTLETCKSHLQPIQDSLPADVCEALDKTLEGCKEQARTLRGIFEDVLPAEHDRWKERYSKILKRLGKGNKVEELMVSITEDVQLVVNHHAVKSAKPEQMAELEKIVQEIKALPSSLPEEERSGMTFTSKGDMENYINQDRGNLVVNRERVENQHFVFKEREYDFSFRKPVGTCLGQAPYIDPILFIGRESEIGQMRKILAPNESSSGQRRLVLGGTGGMGKTQLAITFARRYKQEYDSVFWFNAESEATLKDSFRLMAQAIFDVQDAQILQDEQSLIQARRWLSDKKNTRWLLIFDNYDEPDQYQIERYYPYVSHGAIMVTTRRPDLVAGTELRLQPLQGIEQSLAILETRSERTNVKCDIHARRLAERLAGLPLALATAGAYLRHSTFSFERYLKEYEKHWNIDPRRPLPLQEYQERTLYTTWDLSYSRLNREDPDAAKVLGLLAYFSSRRFWYELFRAGLSDDSPPWLCEVISSDVGFESAMRKLTSYCFLEVQTSVGSWSMHTCVHDWTLAVLNRVVDETQYWYAFDCVGESIEQEDFTSLGHLRPTDLAAHALWLGYVSDRRGKIMKNLNDSRLDRAYIIASTLADQVQLEAAEQMYMLTLAGYERARGAYHPSTLNTVNNFGNLYVVQGKLDEAEKMYERALAGYEKVFGAYHPSTLKTVHNLGNLCRRRGKLDEAETMYERALAEYEKALGADHPSTFNTVNNLGSLYVDQGKLDEAEKMYERALAGYEKALGADHPSTLGAVNNLGSLYVKQGRPDEAEKMYERALAGYEKALAAGHPSTFNTVNNLGNLYVDQGKLHDGKRMYERALAGYEKALGAYHPSTLDTVNNLGNLYRRQGKLDEADKMYGRAMVGYGKALGADHPSTLGTVNNLGVLYVDQGKLDEAEKMYEQALAGYETSLAADHPSTLNTVNNLGNLYVDQGKLGEAEKMYGRALAGYEKAFGAYHPSTLNTVNNLGLLYVVQGKLGKAEKMYERALAGYEKALAADHPSTFNTINNLGNLYVDQGKLDEGQKMYERALAGYEKALGADHPSTLGTVNNLGNLYVDQGKLDEAEKMYARALAGCEKAFGAYHSSTLNTVNNLGLLYVDQGKLEEGKKMYERALQGFQKSLGANHPSTITIMSNLQRLQTRSGDVESMQSTKSTENAEPSAMKANKK